MNQHSLSSAQSKQFRRCLQLISALFLLLTLQTQIIAQTGCDSIDDEIPDNNIIENPIILDETGNAVIEASFFDNGTTDNCDTDLDFGIDQTTFDCMDVGSIQLNFIATDDAGNFSVSSIFTTVVDATPPTAICQTATVQLDAAGNGNLLATAVDNGSNDACGIAEVLVCVGAPNSPDGVQGMAVASFELTCEAINEDLSATLFVTDINDNVSTCTAAITIEDNSILTAECQDITVQLDGDGNATILVSQIDNGSQGACSMLTLDNDSFNCADVGTNIVELTVSNGANSVSCTAIVLVEDDSAPDINCQTVTIQLDETGTATVNPADANDGSTDNCTASGDLIFGIFETDEYNCNDIGGREVSFTATDESGNLSGCSGFIIVEDNILPTLSCPGDLTVAAGEACTFTGLNEQVIAEDNCSIFRTVFSLTNLNNALLDTVPPPPTVIAGSPIASLLADLTLDLGENEFDFETEDIAGNTAACDFTINVEDQTSPEALCQDVQVNLDADGNGTLSIAQINNGSNDNCTAGVNLTFALDQTDFTCSEIGENTVTLTVTDDAGNEDTCTATVTVRDFIAPEFPLADSNGICSTISLNVDENGLAEAVTISDLGVTDNCTQTSDLIIVNPPEISCDDIDENPILRNYVVRDESGILSFCSYEIILIDNILPTISCPADVTLNTNTAGGFENFSEAITFTENCSVNSISVTITEPAGNSSTNELDINNLSLAEILFDFGTTNVQITIEDKGGNSAECSFNLRVEDQTPPTAICQNASVVLDENGNGAITPDQINNGSNDTNTAEANLLFALNQTDFDCSAVGENTVTLNVTDEAGNEDTCTATVTVEDNTAPDINCQTVTIELNEAGTATVNPADANDGSTDNCTEAGDIIFSLSVSNEFNCSDVGSNFVMFRATDESGNFSQCTNFIFVEDNISPTLSCPENLTVAAGEACTFTGLNETVSADDNCSIFQTTFSLVNLNAALIDSIPPPPTVISGSPIASLLADLTLNLGENEFDFETEDIAGNTATCDFTINVTDQTAPEALCQDVTIELDDDGNGTLIPEQIDNGSSDNCTSNLLFSLDAASFDCSDIGESMVTLTVTDEAGNANSCMATVTVEDNTAPDIICQTVTVQLDAAGTGTLNPADANDGTTDNCTEAGDIIFSLSGSFEFDCSDIGEVFAPFTATDEAGNSSQCSGTIVVEDNMPPTALCQAVTVQIDADGSGTLSATEVDNGSSDVCGFSTVLVTLDGIEANAAQSVNLDCDDVNMMPTATLFVTDEGGNTSSCTATISVEDNIAPSVDCVPFLTPFAVNEDCILPALSTQIFDGSITDNCDALTFTEIYTDEDGNELSNVQSDDVTNLTFNRIDLPVGLINYSLTFTDAGGNSDNCTFNISVIDNTPPTAVCQDITAQLDETGNVAIAAADIDNGSTDNCSTPTFTLDNTDFTCTDVGTNTVTLTATDDSSNMSTCTANVTVEDNVAPTALCQAVTVQIDADGNGTLSATQVDNGSNDACGINTILVTLDGVQANAAETVNFDCDNVNETPTATLFVTDVNDNSSNCTAIISIEDNIAPSVDCVPFLTPFAVNEDCIVPALSAEIFVGSITDNCDALTFTEVYTDEDGNELSNVESDDVTNLTFNRIDLPVGLINYSLTFTDAGGNSDNCTFNISVIDNTPPTAVCQDITAQLDETGNVTIAAVDVDNGSTDNCSNPTFTLDNTDFTCANIGSNTVNLTATDDAGNMSTCDANVLIEDNVAPEAVCQAVTVQLDANGNGILLATDVNNGSNDACGIADLLVTFDGIQANATALITVDCEDLGGLTATLFVSDVNGNSSDCTAAISVEDNIDPIAECMDFTVSLDDDGVGSISPIDIDNGSTDNCTEAANLVFALVGNTSFSCTSVGENSIILSVTDESANTETCNAIVTVEDNSPAIIECRQPVSTTNTSGICGVENLTVLEPFSLFDNCGAENVIFTRIPAGNDFPIGTTELNWTATDANGNTSTCQSLVIIQDSEAPTISFCNTAIDFVDPGSCLAQVVVSADIFDNCGVANIEGTGVFSLPFGIHPNPITITDVNGNVTVHDFTIFVHDDLNPVFANCPADTVFLQAGIDGTAPYPVQTPVATDNCGVPTITNDLPEDGFPIGSSVVTFTAEDEYGNTTDCVVNIEVLGGIAMHPQGDIESSLAEDETTQNVSWNALNAATFCELCEETELEDFQYIGTWWGHQYFLANESSLTRDDAALIAEGYDAHLAVINDAAENAYLTEALDENTRSAWIGLLPEFQEEEWTFAWDNGDVFDFEVLNFDSITADTRIILGNDGTWKQATDTEDKFFLIERPCVDFVQTAPIYAPEVEEGEEEVLPVLLRSGDAWPEGEYEVTYALTDMCGNESNLNFEVDVLSEIAEYCTTVATENSVWIEEFVFHDLVNESEDNAGYADFTEETTTMNIGDGIVLLKMSAGGNEAGDSLFWNVYLDANADGDFFDAGEMLYQIASSEDIETNLTLPVVSLENARLRVMVSRYAFAAPCGDTYVGEIEDYNLNLLISEDYARAVCEVQVAGLSGEKIGTNVELDWTVNSACPIDNYTIEYSTDGQNFATVTQIFEQDATDVFYNADYTTALPDMEETVIYRVKVQPVDQAAFYTNTVNFATSTSPNQVGLYPNPADNFVRVSLASFVGKEGRIVIYDNMGKVRLTQDFDATTGDDVRLDLRKFTDGIYHVSIEANAKRTQTKRLIINKLYGWNAVNK